MAYTEAMSSLYYFEFIRIIRGVGTLCQDLIPQT
jgi:hypothetical protein